jgi:tetratricopeptide (TPR) repeat protein
VLLVSCGAEPAKTVEAYAHAKVAYAQGRIDDAMHELADLLSRDPSFAPARLLYGRALYFHRDYESARRILERLTADRTDSVEASLWLVRTLVQLQKPSEAEALLVRLLTVNPDDSRLAYQMGLIKEGRNELAAAQEFFQSAALADEDAALVHFESGRLYYQLRRTADARAELARALAMLGPQSLLRGPIEELIAGVKP